MIDKTRKEANKVESMVLIGDVTDKHVVIIDDMCDTGSTLVKGCDLLLANKAKHVSAIVTHGVLSGHALENIYKSDLYEFICSDSLPIKPNFIVTPNDPECNLGPTCIETSSVITQISTAQQIALAIKAINTNASVDELKHMS